MSNPFASAVSEFSERKRKEELINKRKSGLKLLQASHVDMALECIKTLPKLDWQAIQEFKPSAYPVEDWQTFVSVADQKLAEIFRLAGNSKITGIAETPMKDIRVNHIGQVVAVEGKIIGLGEIEPIITVAKYRCLKCGNLNTSIDGKPVRECEVIVDGEGEQCKSRYLELDTTESEYRNSQVILLQELSSDSKRQLTLSCIATDEEFFWPTTLGRKVKITGVFQVEQIKEFKSTKPKFLKRLHIINIEKLEAEIIVTEADRQRIQEMVKDPLHMQLLVESYAPHLFGVDEQKEVCIYTLASCGINRPFNSILGGPPARGKTQMLEWTAAMHPLGFKVTATGTSIPGLTSISEKDKETETHITKPGLFALHDGGIVCITELQGIRGKDALKLSLNDALESKEISAARADGPVLLRARCAVLIDTNNYAASWMYGFSFAHNIKFMEPNLGAFISRLDLISIVPQVNDDEFYERVARSNFKTTDTEEALRQYKDDWTDTNGIPHYGVDTLRKYFAYVTSLPLPELKLELEDMFAKNYAEVSKNAKEYTIDGRYNRTVKTLARVRARLFLKQQADEEDLKIAIEIVNRSKDVQTKTAEGDNDANASVGVDDKKTIQKRETRDNQFWDCYTKAFQKDRGYTTESAWRTELKLKDWTDSEISKWIQAAELGGKITIGKNGYGNWTKTG